MKKIKTAIVNIIGKYRFGVLEYYLRPKIKEVWGGGFNGQDFRKKIFNELIELIDFSAIIETGTHRGSTTEYMRSRVNIPVYTVETNPRFYAFAKKRLSNYSEIFINLNDSRTFLNELASKKDLNGGIKFFYLDAHWGDDLPLVEEINIIYSKWENSVVMIDDFHVPGDDGYGFQSYKNGKKLTLDYLNAQTKFSFTAFFPKLPSGSETGAKRGCVILVTNKKCIDQISSAKTLRKMK